MYYRPQESQLVQEMVKGTDQGLFEGNQLSQGLYDNVGYCLTCEVL